MEDIRKPSKKGKWSNAHPTSSSSSTSPSSSSSKFALPRSFSTKSSSSNSPSCYLVRSGSQRSMLSSSSSSSTPPSKCSLSRSLSQKGSNVTRRCSNFAKEQKSKFYIMKRCVAMLIRWPNHDDS